MSDLETTLHDLAARGDITHLSLVPSQDGKLWRACYAPASVFGHTFAEDKDPVKAIMMAFKTTKLKSRAPRMRDEPETINALSAAPDITKIETPLMDAAYDPAA